jgi:hypothetical protein
MIKGWQVLVALVSPLSFVEGSREYTLVRELCQNNYAIGLAARTALLDVNKYCLVGQTPVT